MDNLTLKANRAAAFLLTAQSDDERELTARLRREVNEEIDGTIFYFGCLIAILAQFPRKMDAFCGSKRRKCSKNRRKLIENVPNVQLLSIFCSSRNI